MKRRILISGIALAALVAWAPAARAQETRVLGVEFSQFETEEQLALRIDGPPPNFNALPARQDNAVVVELEGAVLEGGDVEAPIARSASLKSYRLVQAAPPPNGLVRLEIEMGRWTPYSVVDKDGLIVVSFAAPNADAIASMQAGVAETATGGAPAFPASGAAAAPAVSVMQSPAASPAAPDEAQPAKYEPLPATPGAAKRRVDRPEDFGLRGGVYDKIVSVSFKDAPLDAFIRTLAAQAELNILFDPNDVKGSVSVELKNVRLGVVLENVLKVNGLAYIPLEDGILRIVRASVVGKTEVELKTEVIVLNWVKSKDLNTTLRPFISPNGQITSNDENNSIIVTDTPPNLENVRQLIAELDVPEKQVMIEMHLVDVLQDFNKAHGANWSLKALELEPLTTVKQLVNGQEVDVIVPKSGSLFDTIGFNSPLQNPVSTMAGASYLTDILGKDFLLDIGIQANNKVDFAQVLANPRVITLNNLEAVIDIQDQIPFIQGEQAQQGGALEPVQRIEYMEAGERITVTPTITANGYVRMQIEVLQDVFRAREGPGALAPPRIDSREATTNVIVRDGSTIALGGLQGHRMIEGREGTPWLMDVPVLRWLFQSKKQNITRSTLYLFVRPTIIPVEASELAEDEKFWFDGVDRNWSVPDEFMDDVHGFWDAGVTP